MKVAYLTGATGLLGINLAERLLADGWKVHCLHRPSSNLKYLKRLEVERCPGDLTDLASLEATMPENVDVVFHCAADANFWGRRNQEQWDNNVLGTRNMIEAAIRRKAKRFINTSSIVVYGSNGGRPITPETPQEPDPLVNLSVTKKLAEDEARKGSERGLDVVHINCAGIVGPYDLRGWAAMFFPIARGEPQFVPRGGVMTWNHVRDVVTAHVNAVEHGKSGFNYLLGGVESDWAEYLETAAGVMGLPVEIQRWPLWALNIVTRLIMVVDRIRGQVPSATPQLMRFLNGVYRCDSEPACRDLGFEFTPLEEMVRHSYEWMVDEHFLEPPRTAGALASGGSGPS